MKENSKQIAMQHQNPPSSKNEQALEQQQQQQQQVNEIKVKRVE